MDATVFDLAVERHTRSIRPSTVESSLTRLNTDGLALLRSATSFWAEYAIAQAFCLVWLNLIVSSGTSKNTSSETENLVRSRSSHE